MATFRTTLIADVPAQRVLDHLADFTTVADWDPGAAAATLTSGEPGQVGAVIGGRAARGLRDELASLVADQDTRAE